MEQQEQTNLERELDTIRAIRDELKLQAHLAASDLRDEVHRLEKKWERLREELQRTVAHVQAPLNTIEEKVRVLMEELKLTCTRIREALAQPEKPS